MGRDRKKINTRRNKPNIFGLLKPYRWLVAFLIIFALLSNGANLVIPKIISKGIDTFSQGNFSFKTIGFEFFGVSLIIFIFGYLQMIVQTYASEKVGFDLRKKLSDKISRQSFAFIQEANPSKLLTNLTSDIDSVKTFVS
ncbi:MAG TPA: ABC transporter transmembrane domain-containing protein, partial [Draconibacterium sp.]|nr:ABC transporter transmembrane domain-containing protein [Draconibacterium sp.]